MITGAVIRYVVHSLRPGTIAKQTGIVNGSAIISETSYLPRLYLSYAGIQVTAATVSVIYRSGFRNIDIAFFLSILPPAMKITYPRMPAVMIFQNFCHRRESGKQRMDPIAAVDTDRAVLINLF